ncbi:MAG: UDP-N-acetylmuramoyl-L-alanyl-D-glutamate--2,6-diaminopimelate ligase [Pseudomonadota bacterium]
MMTANTLQPSCSLKDLFADIAEISNDISVTGIAIDSRLVKTGDLFMAYTGTNQNGVDFIPNAIEAGAVAIAVEEDALIDEIENSIEVIRVNNLRQSVGVIASRFFGQPSETFNVIGVTGTNGKTTVAYMIMQALNAAKKESAFIGTLGYGTNSLIHQGSMTTPDPIQLHSLFSTWRNELHSAVMEVSSHALDQGRVNGTAFNIAVFTNLSRDHLDYHNTVEEYAAAKSLLFTMPDLKHAVINADDTYGKDLIALLNNNISIVAFSTDPEIKIKNTKHVNVVDIKASSDRQKLITIESEWGRAQITTSLLGEFNISNILAVFSVLCLSGLTALQAADAISGFYGVPGRMECFSNNEKAMLVVDYAHTPDALEKALVSLRPYCEGKLYCVFGCGGDRDIGKRPEMGAIAESYADVVVLTNDNPRTEKPERIISQILAGMQNKERVAVRYDRSDAIINTYLETNFGDIVLIAGKGHETTQTIGDEIAPFSDRELARRLVEVNA